MQATIAVDIAPASPKPSEYIAYPEGYVPPAKPAEPVAVPPAKPAEPVAVPLAEPVEPVAMPTVQQELMPAMPNIPPATATLATIAGSGEGLFQIETDPGKLNAVVNVEPANPTPPTNRRRTRQREVYVENEPLMQVETQHPQA